MMYLIGYIKRNDIKAYYFLNRRIHCGLLSLIMKSVTRIFDPINCSYLLMAVMVVAEIINSNVGIYTLVLLLIGQVFVHVMKYIFNRKRPFDVLQDSLFEFTPPKDIYSFPSGHTCAAFSFAVALSCYMPTYQIYFMGVASLVGISRIYLGYHYPMDVLVGAILPMLINRLVYILF